MKQFRLVPFVLALSSALSTVYAHTEPMPMICWRNTPKPLLTLLTNSCMLRPVASSLKTLPVVAVALFSLSLCSSAEENVLGVSEIDVSPDGKKLFVSARLARKVLLVDLDSKAIVDELTLKGAPSGLVFSPDGTRVHILSSSSSSSVEVYKAQTLEHLLSIPAGHSSEGIAVSPDGKWLYVCNRFNNNVVFIDLEQGKVSATVQAVKEPISVAVTPDGKLLVVANHLPLWPATEPPVSSVVTLIDTRTRDSFNVKLPDGSMQLRDLCISADGKMAYVTHNIANYMNGTSQLDAGWMGAGSVSIIDLKKKAFSRNLLLDSRDRGAPNPWGISFADDEKLLCVTHSGSHDMNIIRHDEMMKRLEDNGEDEYRTPFRDGNVIDKNRERVKLPGNGPRSMTVFGSKAYVAEYFSDTVAVVDLVSKETATIDLGAEPRTSLRLRGEMLFHDARLCFQEWQSCATCHPGGRSDGINWDLLNDGLANNKNTKSLLYSHETPPVMITGVRATAEVAVRSGIEFILFNYDELEKEAEALDVYLKSLEPMKSPYLVDGKLSKAAKRGKKLFESTEVGCFACHPAPLYTDKKKHRVEPSSEDTGIKLDTPTLVEIWRTAPYMYDGRYTTISQVIEDGLHGSTIADPKGLSEKEMNDLIEFVLSL